MTVQNEENLCKGSCICRAGYNTILLFILDRAVSKKHQRISKFLSSNFCLLQCIHKSPLLT